MGDFVFLEGWDYYFSGTATPNGAQAQWVKGFLDQRLEAGKRGGKRLAHQRAGGTEDMHCDLPQGSITTGEITIGFAFEVSNAISRPLMVLNQAGGTTQQFTIYQNSDGSLALRNGATILGTSAAGLLVTGTEVYIEVAVTIANSGSFEMRLNNTMIASATGVDTMGAADVNVGRITLPEPASSGTMYYDDLYVRDDLNFAGPSMIVWRRPLAAIPGGDFNLAATSAYIYPLLVDDYSTDTTAYITGDAVAEDQFFSFETFASLTGSGVKAISLIAFAKVDAGTATVDPVVVSNGDTLTAASWSFDTTFRFRRRVVTNDPDTGAAWTRAALAAMHAGMAITALSGGATTLQVSMFGYQALIPIGNYSVAGGHRYWRIVANSAASGSGRVGTCNFSLVAPDGEMFSPVAVGGDGGAFGSLARTFTIDGRKDTNWVSGLSYVSGVNLSLDFGGPVIPKKVVLGSQSGSTSESLRTFTIDYSDDGVSWTTLYNHTTPEISWGADEVRSFVLPDLTPPPLFGRRRQALVLN